ncbi:MAG: hypothetical protein Q8Q94_00255 [bacterium]|nr:hypothetical protein [bacterium]
MPTKARETKTNRAGIVASEIVDSVRYPLPKSWTNAIGILKGKKVDAVGYQRRIRQEWNKRMQKQLKSVSS